MSSNENFWQNLYGAFNRREIETVLSMIAEDVKWANGMEGGFLYGKDNVREYWRRQFEVLNPQLEILKIETDAENRTTVTVHQLVKDLAGNLLADRTAKQIFTLKDGLIKTFEIGETE
jgi:ketosteroid isomerase-like protein